VFSFLPLLWWRVQLAQLGVLAAEGDAEKQDERAKAREAELQASRHRALLLLQHTHMSATAARLSTGSWLPS
jgi:hypothetical protein